MRTPRRLMSLFQLPLILSNTSLLPALFFPAPLLPVSLLPLSLLSAPFLPVHLPVSHLSVPPPPSPPPPRSPPLSSIPPLRLASDSSEGLPFSFLSRNSASPLLPHPVMQQTRRFTPLPSPLPPKGAFRGSHTHRVLIASNYLSFLPVPFSRATVARFQQHPSSPPCPVDFAFPPVSCPIHTCDTHTISVLFPYYQPEDPVNLAFPLRYPSPSLSTSLISRFP
ncbi:hypothetical protein DFH94DRAFT_711498 [Russula ochroleuca]|jgi:hypothetical protein|uniref:Uncharacterized protein n=1 Tax=Russula ochroleuca TaxID=152965 RepID=A0A9P5TDB1_9AGAM|nr:hypothetical protein DFH94DRAFT_711498 [Russula ochroleuca]